MKKKSIIIGWICSYLIILLIPVSAIFINYLFNMRVIKKEIVKANELVMNDLGSSIDRYLEEEKMIFPQLLNDTTFYKVVTGRKKNAQFYYDAALLQQKLATYNSQMSCILYLKELDYVIENNIANDGKTFYQTMRSLYPNISEYEDWMQEVSGEYKDRFFLSSDLNYKTSEECLVYANSVQDISGYEAFNVIISIPISKLEKLTAPLGDGSRLFIRVNDQNVIVLSNLGMEETQEISWSQEGTETLEGEEYISIYKPSGVDGIEYCLLIPQREFWKESQFVRNMLWVCVCITLLVGMGGVSVALNRNFKPIAKLVIKVTGEKSGHKNEFELIENAYTRLTDENNRLYKHVISQKEAMERQNLLSMMKGRYSETIENGISIQKGQFIALVAFQVPFLKGQQYKQDELMLFAVDNIFAELMQECEYYRIEDGQMLFYLFVLEREQKEWREQCMEKAGQLCTIMHNQFEINVLSTVSDVTDDYHDVHIMYQNMLEVFESRKYVGGFGVLDASLRSEETSEENALVQSIKEYVKEHYADENLNISTLADGIGKNPKYIARVFKAQTQEGLLDYINRVRMDKAIVLLNSKQYTVEQISEMLGYSNSKTFRRAFQKVTGMTPGKAF